MSERCVIGIDPGAKGGIAFFSRDGTLTGVAPMPLDHLDEVDPLELLNLLDVDPILVAVEKVGPNPKWGPSSIFTFGRNLEVVIAVCKILELPYDPNVLPRTWKDCVLKGTKKDKAAALAHVRARYPEWAGRIGKHDGMGDATCIGEYAVRELLGERGGRTCP